MLGFQRRLVRRWEWEMLCPKPGPLPQTSQLAATCISSSCTPRWFAGVGQGFGAVRAVTLHRAPAGAPTEPGNLDRVADRGQCAQTPGRTARDRLCLLYTSPSPRDGLLSRMP